MFKNTKAPSFGWSWGEVFSEQCLVSLAVTWKLHQTYTYSPNFTKVVLKVRVFFKKKTSMTPVCNEWRSWVNNDSVGLTLGIFREIAILRLLTVFQKKIRG